MSVLTRTNGAAKPGADGPVDSRARPAPPQSVTPPRLRRRPLLIGLSVVAVCLGALLGAWAYTSTTNAQGVVAVRTLVERGQVIDRDDLVTVRIGVDPALQPIPADGVEQLGRSAGGDRSAGGRPGDPGVGDLECSAGSRPVGGRRGFAGVPAAGRAVAAG